MISASCSCSDLFAAQFDVWTVNAAKGFSGMLLDGALFALQGNYSASITKHS